MKNMSLTISMFSNLKSDSELENIMSLICDFFCFAIPSQILFRGSLENIELRLEQLLGSTDWESVSNTYWYARGLSQ